MRPPIFVRELTDTERAQVEAGLRSSDAFTLRRCQIVLASARGERAPVIARHLGCDDQTVREAIRAFDARGVAALRRGSHRPETIRLTLKRLGIGWKRAKRWITSPDPEYARKNRSWAAAHPGG